MFKTAKRVKTEAAWTKFRQKRNSVTKQIREAKQHYNEKLANELRDTTNSSSWYKTTSKLLKSKAVTHSIPYLETQNDLAETEIEIAQVLNSYFANQSTVDDTNAVLPILELPSYPPLSDIYISVNDVKDAISLLKPNKAPGPDLITPKLPKEGANQLLAPLSFCLIFL